MQWDSSPYAGFSASKPWIKVCGDYPVYNVEKESGDPDSVLNFAKKAIALRQSEDILDTLIEGTFLPLDQEDQSKIEFEVVGKETIHFVSNISEKEIKNPACGKGILLENKGAGSTLPPYGVAIYLD